MLTITVNFTVSSIAGQANTPVGAWNIRTLGLHMTGKWPQMTLVYICEVKKKVESFFATAHRFRGTPSPEYSGGQTVSELSVTPGRAVWLQALTGNIALCFLGNTLYF